MSAIEFPEGTLYALLEHYGWDLRGSRPGWHTVKCGAHKDSHASCRVNDQIGAAKCQACDFQGDLIKIVRYYEGEGTTFHDAVKIIERATGISGSQVSGSPRTGRSISATPRTGQRNSGWVSPRLRRAATTR